jgi:hypothetical protein
MLVQFSGSRAGSDFITGWRGLYVSGCGSALGLGWGKGGKLVRLELGVVGVVEGIVKEFKKTLSGLDMVLRRSKSRE